MSQSQKLNVGALEKRSDLGRIKITGGTAGTASEGD
jgi:hypothetical protein